MSSPQAPTAPDPVATANAQAAMNKETAIAQYGLSATNQNTPQGSINYQQIGTWPDGTPRYQSTTAYSPGEQNIYETGLQTRKNVGDIARDQSSRIGNLLATPLELKNPDVEGRINELARTRLDPYWKAKSNEFDTKLATQGITDPGSDAYVNAHRVFGQQENDAYNQMYLTGRQQANQELLTERNQPINEISALMSGSQVSQPNFSQTPSVPVQPTDYTGAVRDSYNAQMAGYNANLSSQNAMMGGLFGLAAAPLGGFAMANRSPFRLF